MIRFKCERCGRELVLADTCAGKKGRCPRCRQILHVPQAGETSPTNPAGNTNASIGSKDALLLDLSPPTQMPTEEKATSALSGGVGQGLPGGAEVGDSETSDEAAAGWIDALLYPTNANGLVQIGILTVALWAVGIFGLLIGSFLRQYGGLLVLILRLLVVGYMVYYLSYCIFDSSRGGRRAATISTAHTPDLWDLFSQLLLLLASVAICFSAAAVYYIATERADTPFWVMVMAGAFFFPMTLLTATLFDGIDALNPMLIIRSILVTLPTYLVLIVELGVLALVLAAANWASPRLPIPRILWNVVYLYLLLIGSHLLGRFYCRHKDALDWGL